MKLKDNSAKKISFSPLIIYLFILEIGDEGTLRQRVMEEIGTPKLANYIT